MSYLISLKPLLFKNILDERTKVFQEVLADLKNMLFEEFMSCEAIFPFWYRSLIES